MITFFINDVILKKKWGKFFNSSFSKDRDKVQDCRLKQSMQLESK